MEIIPLQSGDVAEFIRFSWRVYEGDHLWVPPLIRERKAFLDPDRNPFFQHARVQLFLAREGHRTVARLAAVVNDAHDRFHGEKAGFFGLFECLPGAQAAAMALLGAAEAWVRDRDATFLRGPVNLSTNELECGLLVEGFGSAPVFGSSYNPPYYAHGAIAELFIERSLPLLRPGGRFYLVTKQADRIGPLMAASRVGLGPLSWTLSRIRRSRVPAADWRDWSD